MGWPQIAAIVILSLDVGVLAAMHGKPRTGNYNLFTQIISVIAWVTVLYAGGFWGGR